MRPALLPLLLSLFCVATSSLALAADSDWRSAGTMRVPPRLYNFLATTPQGHLIATTINSEDAGRPPANIPALLILNPTSSSPEVRELLRIPFDSNRGFSGIASNPDSTFFISGDTGDTRTGFVRKFLPDGSPDTSFGDAGVLLPGRRCLGIDVIGGNLLMAVDWGKINVYDVKTGRMTGSLPPAPVPQGPPAADALFVRDVAIDPRSMRVFGVVQGGLVTWGGGAPWEPAKYQFRELAQRTTPPTASEGVCIDPFQRTVLITPIPGNTLVEVHGNGRLVRYPIPTAQPDTHLVDSVISFDGTTLFISDVRARQIHLMTRTNVEGAAPVFVAPATVSATTTTAGASDPATSPFVATGATGAAAGTPTPITWFESYETVVQQARQQRRPMLVYFRATGAKPSQDFENSVLKLAEFSARASRFVNVRVDAATNRRTAASFGVVRVPTVILFNGAGDSIAEFRGVIPASDLLAAMDSVQ